MAIPEADNLIVRLTFEFSLLIIEYTERLEAQRRYVMAKQLMRSGTAIGANVREAQSSESRADFVHKCKIAAKEAEETDYWLLLCYHAPSYESPGELLPRLLSIRKILSKIISSARSTQPSA
ncbi:four helix bundle protein [Hymenobacter sp. BT523]|uniref:four helix bundle protein n=1 Tax=Hymenobacter sp. BT523 TaxID=2795725 RepID=UPI00293D2FB3|nr:four helix bundle protein [Hymenobacter sp. BT523]